jgi:Tat protein translocase TatB subunit
MFDLSLAEVALIVVVAVVFIGPKELPAVIRAMAKAMRSLRAVAGEIRQAFDEVSRESGIKDAAEEIDKEVRMIRGDDGQFYESHDLSKLPKSGERNESQ